MEDMVLEEISDVEIPVEETSAEPVAAAETQAPVLDKKAQKQQAKAEKRAAKQQEKDQRHEDKQERKAQRYEDKQQRKADKHALKAKKKEMDRIMHGRRPHIVLRIFMKTACILLAIVLAAGITATVLLSDAQHMTSSDGINQLITALITAAPAKTEALPTVRPAPQLNTLSTGAAAAETTEGNASQLVELLYNSLIKDTEYAADFSLDDLQEFVAGTPAVTEFLADKAASYIDDFINDTHNTQITADELIVLLEECAPVLEEKFDFTLSEEDKEALRDTLEEQIEESKINDVIGSVWREEMSAIMNETIGFDLSVIQQGMQFFLSNELLYACIGVCLLLAVMMCLLSYYNLPAGLSWVAGSCIAAGAVVSLPLAALQFGPELLAMYVPQITPIASFLSTFLGGFALLHYGIFVGGVVLLIAATTWRIIVFAVRKKRAKALA